MYFLFYPKPWYEEVAGIILQMSIPDITILNWQISFRSAETISCGAVGAETTNNLSLNDEFIMQLSPNEIKPYIFFNGLYNNQEYSGCHDYILLQNW